MPLPVSDPTDQLLTLTVARDGRRAHIWAAGEVDTSTAPRLAAALDGALADGAPEVAVDLAGVTLLTCAGVHALAAGHRRAASAGGRVHVFASRAVVRRPLELSGLWQRVGADRDPGRRPHAA